MKYDACLDAWRKNAYPDVREISTSLQAVGTNNAIEADRKRKKLRYPHRWVSQSYPVTPRTQLRFRFRVFIHQVLQQGKCLESGKHTNISKQQH